jgi:hypothetical protein
LITGVGYGMKLTTKKGMQTQLKLNPDYINLRAWELISTWRKTMKDVGDNKKQTIL